MSPPKSLLMPQGDSPREIIGPVLGDVTRLWRTLINKRLKPTGLSQATWFTLIYLAQAEDGMVQTELAEQLGIEGPTLVRLLDRLEAEGLVERRPHECDRRCKVVRLTPAAEPVVHQVRLVGDEFRDKILADIPDEAVRQAVAVLLKMRERLESLSDPD